MVIKYRDSFLKVFGLMILLIFATFFFVVLWFKLSYRVYPYAGIAAVFIVLLVVSSEVLYFYCHYLLAKAKGYTGWLVLLGLIHVFGIAIIAILPDRAKNPPASFVQPPASSNTKF